MEINVSKSLNDLAEIFSQNGGTLYIVGGYVRNAILGFCETDVDLCGALTTDEIRSFLDKDLYTIKVVNPKLGTIHINPKFSDEEYEYTTFRAENYQKGGKHSPLEVVFVKDIKLDASRRDFTANSIYYDIKNKTIIDFYNGVQDVNNRVLRTVETPEYVFNNDGLRMLRMVRIACELDFSINNDCFDTACKMIDQLKDISHERYNKEIVSILFADYKYDHIKNPYSVIMGMKLLSQMKAWQYILPNICSTVSTKIFNEKLQNGEWVKLLSLAPAPHRITTFTIDILNCLGLTLDKYNILNILGINGIMLSHDEVELQTKIIVGYDTIMRGFLNEDDKRLFIQDYSDLLDRICGVVNLVKPTNDLIILRDVMLLDNVPMSVSSLAINGNDLIEKFPKLNKKEFSNIFNQLLRLCCFAPELNNKKSLLGLVEKKYKKYI